MLHSDTDHGVVGDETEEGATQHQIDRPELDHLDAHDHLGGLLEVFQADGKDGCRAPDEDEQEDSQAKSACRLEKRNVLHEK